MSPHKFRTEDLQRALSEGKTLPALLALCFPLTKVQALQALKPANPGHYPGHYTQTPSTQCAAELRHAAFSFQPLSAMKDA